MPYFCMTGGGGSGHVHGNLPVLNAITDAGNGRIGSFDPPPGHDDWEGGAPTNAHAAIARLASAFHKHVGIRVPGLE